ncbi:MAG TPA: hypothetical protein PLC42_03355 [Parachlamydiaceae bacterium]|nr:hypothetical protein [Parachlamydiaceae bacterium]
MKKLVALLLSVAICGASAGNAQEFVPAEYSSESLGGYGYQESRRSPYIAPAVALATVAIVAIVAVAVQNSSHNSHGHSGHCN